MFLLGGMAVLAMASIVSRFSATPLPWQGKFTSPVEGFLRDLGAPTGAGPLADFRTHERDGLQNEEASGSYLVALPAGDVLQHYRVACRRLGLQAPASADTVAHNPGALCDGAVVVTVIPQCDAKGCGVFVKVIG